MSIEFNDDELSTRIIAAAAALKPYQPENLTSGSLVPYFKELGMTDDGIVPSGLREYTTQVLQILSLPPTTQSLQTMLQRTDVQETLKSAIAVSNKVYQEQLQKEAELRNSAGDMENISGITPEQMKYFVQKAIKEKESQQMRTKARNYSTDVFVNPFSPKEEETAKEEPAVNQVPPEQQTAPKQQPEEPFIKLEDKPEPLPEPEVREGAPVDEHAHADGTLFCPRCGWIVSVPYTPEVIEEEDKIQFAYSIMQRMPFKKTYGLFKDQIKVTFRSRTVEDGELLLEQLRQDSIHNKFADLAHMNHYATRYEMALLLESIESSNDSIQYQFKPQYKDFLGEAEPLAKYAEAVYNKYIVSDVLKQLIEAHYRSFNRLYSALIDEAMKENFYNPA